MITVNYINPYIENGKAFYDINILENGEFVGRLSSSTFSENFDTQEAIDRAIIIVESMFPGQTVNEVNIDYNGNPTFNWIR
jgi:hypothetical protein